MLKIYPRNCRALFRDQMCLWVPDLALRANPGMGVWCRLTQVRFRRIADRADAMKEERGETIDAYIAGARPEVRPTLRKIRQLIRKAAPGAAETISYRMLAFRQNGILLYFAAFKNHIGLFPPIKGDEELEHELERYRGPKGNLRFPLDEPMPYKLITRIATLRVAQDAAQTSKSKRRRK